MPDMLVKLYNQKHEHILLESLSSEGVKVCRAHPADRARIAEFAKTFSDAWENECLASFGNNPPSCFIAAKEGALLGFACYDATAKNFFGPIGVDDSARGMGVGRALLNSCLMAMISDGYGYAIIGWVSEENYKFYKTCCDAVLIKDSFPGVYNRLINL
jgi:GNAT superfamily N-acetyltransferase